MGDAHKIYVFDNSNKRPLTVRHNNVEIVDNTKGQIVDFDKWLEKFPNRFDSAGANNKWGSVKHCYSIELCMGIINEPFILLDSDVLLKRDLSELWDESCIYVGRPNLRNRYGVTWRMRLLPMVCFINVPMCREHDIHYFDEYRINGLCNTERYADCERWDTGASFWADTQKYKHRDIRTINDYIVHFESGSWDRPTKESKETPQEWLWRHRHLFE